MKLCQPKTIMVALASMLLTTTAYSQEDSLSQASPWQVKAGIFYQNGLHFLGRTDSVRSSALLGIMELWYKNKWYVQAVPVWVNNTSEPAMQYAGTVAGIGFQPVSKNGKWAGRMALSIPLYRQNITLPQAALRAEFTGAVTRMSSALHLTLSNSLRYSNRIDYGVQLAALHPFKQQLGKGWHLFILPGIQADAGTQLFTESYYKTNRWLIFPVGEELVTETASRFNLLSYEITAPIVLARAKWKLLFQTSRVQPLNIPIPETGSGWVQDEKAFWTFTAGIKLEL